MTQKVVSLKIWMILGQMTSECKIHHILHKIKMDQILIFMELDQQDNQILISIQIDNLIILATKDPFTLKKKIHIQFNQTFHDEGT